MKRINKKEKWVSEHRVIWHRTGETPVLLWYTIFIDLLQKKEGKNMKKIIYILYGKIAAKSLILLIMFLLVFLNSCARKTLIETSGNIEIKEVDIASRVAGRITKINVEKGDDVKKGHVLAEIDDRLVTAQNEDALAFFNQANEDYKRARELYKSGSITRQKFEQAETLFLQAKSRMVQSEVMMDETKVKAPWDGVILDRYVEEGELVSSLVPLFSIGDMRTAKLKIYVGLKDMEMIKINDPAEVRIDAFKNRKFIGKVIYISDKAEFTPKNIQTKDERINEVFAVEILLKNDEGIFKPGMPADAILKIKGK